MTPWARPFPSGGVLPAAALHVACKAKPPAAQAAMPLYRLWQTLGNTVVGAQINVPAKSQIQFPRGGDGGLYCSSSCCRLPGDHCHLLQSTSAEIWFWVCHKHLGKLHQHSLSGLSVACAAADIHKLAGTALTLMGGLAAWLMKHPTYLPQVLDATITALRSPDDKLARNAATCVQRLTSYEQLASLLFAAQPASVQQLLQEYQRRGGLPVTLGELSDDADW